VHPGVSVVEGRFLRLLGFGWGKRRNALATKFTFFSPSVRSPRERQRNTYLTSSGISITAAALSGQGKLTEEAAAAGAEASLFSPSIRRRENPCSVVGIIARVVMFVDDVADSLIASCAAATAAAAAVANSTALQDRTTCFLESGAGGERAGDRGTGSINAATTICTVAGGDFVTSAVCMVNCARKTSAQRRRGVFFP